MNKKESHMIRAEYDRELKLWSATSDDIPGLFLETESWDELIRAIEENAPYLVEHNVKGKLPDIPIHVQADYNNVLHAC